MQHKPTTEEQDRDLGFGAAAHSDGARLFNRDGSFAVVRSGRGWRAALSAYHTLLTASWVPFLLLLAAVYLFFNLLFAVGYLACGSGGITGPDSGAPFLRAFFLAVQTSSTVGYGQLAPSGVAANFVMVLQAFFSLTLVALGTGVIFARFSRPVADLAWSDHAIVAPYRGSTGLMCRVAHRRKHQIFDLHAKVILSLSPLVDGSRQRSFHELELERDKVSFLPLSWTIVHPIDEDSPLFGMSPEKFRECRGEVIILLQGRDATSSQDVHLWTSYTATEVSFGARFLPVIERQAQDGLVRMDVGRISAYEEV
ncbi:MAG: inward rectifier potassium channel [Planctomycetota bacterium]|jgi:inward rectifier potassium channel